MWIVERRHRVGSFAIWVVVASGFSSEGEAQREVELWNELTGCDRFRAKWGYDAEA